MFRVISEKRWRKWCSSKELNLEHALYSLETCYYGFGLRSRPGTILLSTEKISHYSYSWRDTVWALFEPSTLVQIPLSEIKETSIVEFGFWKNQLHMKPDLAVRLELNDGSVHELAIHRNGKKFIQALKKLGINVRNDQFTA